jgi:hypothetical protein
LTNDFSQQLFHSIIMQFLAFSLSFPLPTHFAPKKCQFICQPFSATAAASARVNVPTEKIAASGITPYSNEEIPSVPSLPHFHPFPFPTHFLFYFPFFFQFSVFRNFILFPPHSFTQTKKGFKLINEFNPMKK